MDLYEELFNYFSNEHGILILQQDMHEIEHIIGKHNEAQENDFTNGDWLAEEIWKENGSFYRVKTKTETVCNITTRNSERAKQNANLISHSKLLLETLKELVKIYPNTKAENLIKKINYDSIN